MSNKQTNMISIRSDVYPESSLASKKSVSGVPTVLYVDSAGQIQEVEESRNMPVMKNIVKNGTPANVVPAPTEPVMEDLPDGDIAAVATSIPGTVTRPSELNILPGSISESLKEMVPPQPTGVQNGGNLSTLIQTAGPAALLLGAYAAFGRTRSSGLPPATRRRRVRFSRRRGRRA